MKVALIYSHTAVKTSQAAKTIKQFSKWKNLDDINADKLKADQLMQYDLLILGAPTWFDGELPDYWDEMVPAIEDLNLSGKKIAIFGNGDQVGYPENFGDAVGLLADVFESTGAKIVGQTQINGYKFESSKAIEEGMFRGLILDFENQQQRNKSRIQGWLDSFD